MKYVIPVSFKPKLMTILLEKLTSILIQETKNAHRPKPLKKLN